LTELSNESSPLKKLKALLLSVRMSDRLWQANLRSRSFWTTKQRKKEEKVDRYSQAELGRVTTHDGGRRWSRWLEKNSSYD